ncbi:hypothetical protein HC891_23345 [Candidatus Gracilibacteria bacterium]|nr:hypothetical protein [Candidatus Gracilibacteria bacterium]
MLVTRCFIACKVVVQAKSTAHKPHLADVGNGLAAGLCKTAGHASAEALAFAALCEPIDLAPHLVETAIAGECVRQACAAPGYIDADEIVNFDLFERRAENIG